MKNKIKTGLKILAGWFFGNVLWTIFTYSIPFALMIAPFKNVIENGWKSLKITDAFWFVGFVLAEILLILASVIYKKDESGLKSDHGNARNNNTKENCDLSDIDNEYKQYDYYFDNYHKHLTVYKDGTGIIINTFYLIINNINSIESFKRKLDIKDAQNDTYFPKLREMRKTRKEDRFKKCGFWYECADNPNLISSVEEHYWTEKDEDSDSVSRADKKVLKWIMRMNPSSIEVGKPYKIVYVISIPKMFPIEEGFFKEELAYTKGTNGKYSSGFKVKHKIKKLMYTVSFEDNIDLATKPVGKIVKGNEQKNNLQYQYDSNIIYHKYIFRAENPDISSSINIEWQFKPFYLKQKGGRNMKGNNVRNENIEEEEGD